MRTLKFLGVIALFIISLICFAASIFLSISHWQGRPAIFASIVLMFCTLAYLGKQVFLEDDHVFFFWSYAPMWVRKLLMPMNIIAVPASAHVIYHQILERAWSGALFHFACAYFITYMMLLDSHVIWQHYRKFLPETKS